MKKLFFALAIFVLPAPFFARTFADSLGREVEIPQKIERVSPLGPIAQTFLFTVSPDLFASIAKRQTETENDVMKNEKFNSLPITGQMFGKNPLNVEALLAASPQVLIDIGERRENLAAQLDKIQKLTGIPAVFVEAKFENYAATYEKLGELLGQKERCGQMSALLRQIFSQAQAGMSKVKAKKRVVYYSLDAVVAKGTTPAKALDLMAENVARIPTASNSSDGVRVNVEQIYEWNPEAIIFAPHQLKKAKGDKRLSSLAAMENGAFETPCKPYNWLCFPPSSNQYLGILWLGKILYPDVFDYELYDECAKFFRIFYRTSLSREKFAEILGY